MFRFGYGTQTLTLQIQVLFGYLLYLLPPVLPPGKVRINATFHRATKKDSFNHWLPWLEIERGR